MKVVLYVDVGPYTDAEHLWLKSEQVARERVPGPDEKRYRIEAEVPNYEPAPVAAIVQASVAEVLTDRNGNPRVGTNSGSVRK